MEKPTFVLSSALKRKNKARNGSNRQSSFRSVLLCRRRLIGCASCGSSVDIALAVAREAGASVSSYTSSSGILLSAKTKSTRTHHTAYGVGQHIVCAMRMGRELSHVDDAAEDM